MDTNARSILHGVPIDTISNNTFYWVRVYYRRDWAILNNNMNRKMASMSSVSSENGGTLTTNKMETIWDENENDPRGERGQRYN